MRSSRWCRVLRACRSRHRGAGAWCDRGCRRSARICPSRILPLQQSASPAAGARYVLEVVLASAVDGDLVDDAQPGAGWAGPFRLIEGKMGHADLWDRLTTVRAGKGCFGRDGIVIRTDMP